MVPMKLRPALKDYLWGGTRLKTQYGKESDLPIVAESWEVSCHKDGPSLVENGPQAGMTLPQAIDALGRQCLGKRGEELPEFPVLIKLIDAKQSLSVQVHPDDAYARRVEGEPGKTEMWLVLACEPGAYLYYGFAKDMTREEFARRIQENTLTDVLQKVEVHPGDTFFIDAGTLHAIGKGVTLLEIQQNSTLTYRVYDYGRRDKDGSLRPLHVEKAAATASLQKYVVPDARRKSFLGGCKYFSAYRYRRGKRFLLHSFASVTVTKGAFAVGDVPLERGETAFVSAEQPFCVKGSGEYVLVCVE